MFLAFDPVRDDCRVIAIQRHGFIYRKTFLSYKKRIEYIWIPDRNVRYEILHVSRSIDDNGGEIFVSIEIYTYLLRFSSTRTHHLFLSFSFFFFFFLQVSASRYPVVVKLGHAHGGVGKARAETNQEFLDLASLAALANAYCTSEPYVDTKYDVHVQKVGNNYKAFM